MGFRFDTDSITPASSSGGGSGQIESLNVTPTTSAQTITAPSGVDGYNPINVSAVTASIDNNIVANNIVSGVSILGVNGSATVLNGETVNITPTTSQQIITPTSPKNGITQATVAAVTSNIDSNIIAGNIKKDVTILGVTGNYEGSGGGGSSGTTDVPLTRISDDNGNEIGTWYMNFEDANGNLFKVICLDAQYRNDTTQWCSDKNLVTNMPIYNINKDLWWYDNAKETATQNTQLILDYCSAGGYTSTACSHCRSKSFTINGTTYYGQFPNMREFFDMYRHRTQLTQMDNTASSHSSTSLLMTNSFWSSTQQYDKYCWYLDVNGRTNTVTKVGSNITCPVLEIPIS